MTYPPSYLEFRAHPRAAIGSIVDALIDWEFDWNPNLVASLDIVDSEVNLVLRTIRVDYDGQRVWGGDDPTHQLTDELTEQARGWFERSNLVPAESATRVHSCTNLYYPARYIRPTRA